MNRDDIIRMALEAGFLDRKESCPLSGESRFDEEICVGEYPVGEIVERFAALVAAHERKSWAPRPDGEGGYELHCAQCWEIAMQETEDDAIRARGEK